MKPDMQGRSVVVLGGTKGIGRAAVLLLAQRGADVVVQGRDGDAASSLIEQCRAFPGERVFVGSDLTTYEGVEAAALAARERFGKVDVIVASGGPREPRPKLFVDLGPEDGLAMLKSRLMPRLYAMHAAVKVMREQKYGKVILLTTDAARTPTPSESMVGAAGVVVMFMARALGAELADLGIRVNAIATTFTADTPNYQRFLEARDSGSNEVIVKAFTKAQQRVKFRLNTAADIAAYISFLAGPESDQVSGSTLSINGGMSFPGY